MKYVTSHIHSVFVYWMKHMISHIYLISVYWMKHMISHIHSISVYWMKHMIFSCQNTAVYTHSFYFLILSQFYLTTVLLLFHSILSCASCILLSLRTATFFKKETFVMNTVLPWLLVSPDYSPCAGQIYISVCSSIALRKSIFFTSHIIMPMCCYRASEPSYTYKYTGRCIETFLCYFHNNHSDHMMIELYILFTIITLIHVGKILFQSLNANHDFIITAHRRLLTDVYRTSNKKPPCSWLGNCDCCAQCSMMGIFVNIIYLLDWMVGI